MKEGHLLRVLRLVGRELAVSAAEGTEAIFRQRAAMIDIERCVEQAAYRF